MANVKLLKEDVVEMGQFKLALKHCETRVDGIIKEHLVISEWNEEKGKWRNIETLSCEK